MMDTPEFTARVKAMSATPAAQAYTQVGHELRDRIIELIRKNPAVANITSAWDLFAAGLKCDDIGPSLAQAQWALSAAKDHIAKAVQS